jgi:hypothetical protein
VLDVLARAQADDAQQMDAEVAGDAADVPLAKRRAYDNVSGKVSHRPWKATFGRASSVAVRAPSDWDAKMRAKAQKKAIQARRRCCVRRLHGAAESDGCRFAPLPLQSHLAAVHAEEREKARAERQRREEAKKRKEVRRRTAEASARGSVRCLLHLDHRLM